MNIYFNYKVNVSLPGIQNYGLTKYMNILNTGQGTLHCIYHESKSCGVGELAGFPLSIVN